MDIIKKYSDIDALALEIKEIYRKCDEVNAIIQELQETIDSISNMNFEVKFNSAIGAFVSIIYEKLQSIYKIYKNSKFLNSGAVCALLASICDKIDIPKNLEHTVNCLLSGKISEIESLVACSKIDNDTGDDEKENQQSENEI